MSTGIAIDPLDAYMDSIAGEITQQATEVPPSPPSPPPTSTSPSPAQRAIADKVSASPFCDVLTSTPRGAGDGWEQRAGGGIADCANQPNRAGGGDGGCSGDAAEACLRLLLGDPAEFLR